MAGIPLPVLVLGWLLSTAGAGLAGAGFWNWLIRRRELDRDDLAAERKAHKECLEKLEAIERRLEVVEHHHSSLFARWIKDAAKRICWVNGRAMATIFGPLGYTRDEVEGRTFQDLLDINAANEIDRLDRAALAQPGSPVWTIVQLHPTLPLMIVVKVAGVGRDQELIYEGHAYPTDESLASHGAGEAREGEQKGLSALRLPDRTG